MKTTENLREKLVAERQSKLLLEVKIRREMAAAMFRQLLETEEAWRQVTLVFCKGFHICKCIILPIHRLHAGHAPMLLREVRAGEFKASDEKGKRSIKKLVQLYLFPCTVKK